MVAILLTLLIPIALSGIIAQKYGQSYYEWFMWAFILGPFSLLIQIRVGLRQQRSIK